MENYYEILGCRPDSTVEELKKAYQKLILIHHPDKLQSQPEASHSDSSMFQLVNRAWRVLNDESLRREYDARWKQNCLVQKWPIQDEVPFEEFEQLEHEDSYSLACRCGGEYVLSRTDIFFKADFVQCGSCSLCVQVMYPHDLQVDDLEMT